MKKSDFGIIMSVILAMIAAIIVVITAPLDNHQKSTTPDHLRNNADITQSDSNQVADIDMATDLTNEHNVTIDIKNFAYTKPSIKIRKGTTVTWINQDATKHNVMGQHDDDEHPHDAVATYEVRPDVLAGPMLEKGQKYSYQFTNLGVIVYHCSPHPYMTGSVTVVD